MVLLFGLLLAQSLYAQGIIEIDSQLRQSSQPLRVKMSASINGKPMKWKFGEFRVVSSQSGRGSESYSRKPFSQFSTTAIEDSFAFLLTGKDKDSVAVGAAYHASAEAVNSTKILPWFSVGSESLLSDSEQFLVSLSPTTGESDPWMLLLADYWKSDRQESKVAEMSNRYRTFSIMPVRSPARGKGARKIPARGYEILEGDRAMAAVQYYGGGVMGLNKNVVWIREDLPPDTRLILAGAITALMEFQLRYRIVIAE